MARNQVAVMDFGSSKITVLVGERGAGNSLLVKAKGMSDYAGFMDGEFLEPEALRNSIYLAINNAQEMLGKKIKRLYIGVPAEFSYNECVSLDMYLKDKTKLKSWHIDRLFEINKTKTESPTHTIINKAPIYYILDDGNRIVNPVNCVSSSLTCHTSFIYVDKQFINLVTESLKSIGINNYEFISSSLAESLYLIDAEYREHGAILVDCGYITTSVTHIVGEGIMDLKSFSIGGGHIAGDISELLKIPFLSAEQLKRKLVISLKPTAHDYYEALVNNKISKFSAKTVNDIALARIDMIGDAILKSFEEFTTNIKPNTKIFLTGGGISYVKGIKDYLSKYLKHEVKIVYPTPLQFNKPDLSSEVSLLEVAINMEN